MTAPFAPGDVVVCVDVATPAINALIRLQDLNLGTAYVVEDARCCAGGRPHVSLTTVPLVDDEPQFFAVWRFRPIRPNEEAARRTWAALLNEPAPAKPSLNPARHSVELANPVLPLSSAGGK